MRLAICISSLLFLATCLCQAESAVVAQNTAANFQGNITDTNGKPVCGASVTIEGANLKQEIKPTCKGQFEISLPAGVYKITVKKSGFVTYELTNVHMTPGHDLSHAFRLECSCPQSAVRPAYR